MIQNQGERTARIYQFPVKPLRADAMGGRPTSGNRRLQPASSADCGSGWYHEAAIKTDKAHPHAG